MPGLPGLTAELALDRPERLVAAPGAIAHRYFREPPLAAAKWCGSTALRFCADDAARKLSLCGQLDCERLCDGPFPGRLCDGCLESRRNCEKEVRDAFADCGICGPDTLCRSDLATASGHGGYSYCCPPPLWPCGGECRPTSCGTGFFNRERCQCECPPGDDCRDDNGRVVDCCGTGKHCSRGHCCPNGQDWVGDRCCEAARTCLQADGWTYGELYTEVTGSREVCCEPPLVCAQDSGPPDYLHRPGEPTYARCCAPGERWITNWDISRQNYAGQCCAPQNICREPKGWTNNMVTGTREVCCSGTCQPDLRWPPYQHCCPTGQTWCPAPSADGIGGHCCPAGTCCGWGCCPAGQHCSQGHCCPVNQDWASSGLSGPGVPAWQQGSCCPRSAKPQTLCGKPTTGFRCCDTDRCCDGTCCLVGQRCSEGHCCPDGEEWCASAARCCRLGGCCGVDCCPAGQQCSQYHCCPPGQEWCASAGRCCEPSHCCIPGGCAGDFATDLRHCGQCNRECGPTSWCQPDGSNCVPVDVRCIDGDCRCPRDWIKCSDAGCCPKSAPVCTGLIRQTAYGPRYLCCAGLQVGALKPDSDEPTCCGSSWTFRDAQGTLRCRT